MAKAEGLGDYQKSPFSKKADHPWQRLGEIGTTSPALYGGIKRIPRRTRSFCGRSGCLGKVGRACRNGDIFAPWLTPPIKEGRASFANETEQNACHTYGFLNLEKFFNKLLFCT
jgi:hypothetical protein